VSNQLLSIHYILQRKQTDDKIFSTNTNKRPLLRPVTFFLLRSLAEGSQAQNFLTDRRRIASVNNYALNTAMDHSNWCFISHHFTGSMLSTEITTSACMINRWSNSTTVRSYTAFNMCHSFFHCSNWLEIRPLSCCRRLFIVSFMLLISSIDVSLHARAASPLQHQ